MENRTVATRYEVRAPGGVVDKIQHLKIEHRMATPLAEVGLQVWGGALLMADLLLANKELVAGKTVLELGCGTGFVGIVASRFCGASKVILTDNVPEVLELASKNAAKNGLVVRSTRVSAAPSKLVVKELDWKDDLTFLSTPTSSAGPAFSEAPDFVWTSDDIASFRDDCTVLLAADVIYDSFATELLLSKLPLLLQPNSKGETRTLYLSIEKRPNFSLAAGKETVRAWDELQSALGTVNERLLKFGLPGRRKSRKRWQLDMQELDVSTLAQSLPGYARSRRMEIWKMKLTC